MGPGQQGLPSKQDEAAHSIGMGKREPQRPHAARRVTQQRALGQLQAVKDLGQAVDCSVAVRLGRSFAWVAEPESGAVHRDRPDTREPLEQREKLQCRWSAAMEQHEWLAVAGLDGVDAPAGGHFDVPALRRGSSEHARVRRHDLVRMRDTGPRCSDCHLLLSGHL